MLEDDFREALVPLLEAGVVDALEWSFDTAWEAPDWAAALLDHFAAADRLYGHGVHFSALSARWEARQDEWLARFEGEMARRRYVHVSEHFGFMTARGFRRGAPMPVPHTDRAVAIGRERIARIAELAKVRVGLENLALAMGPRDVEDHGAFLDALTAPDGFVLLDLHNLYCQSANFGVAMDDLLARYPLARVREIHVSGGSWSHGGFRRDTHDDDVPREVLAFLPRALARCPNVEVVVLERLGGTIHDPDRLRAEFGAVREIVHA
jgi:uncharacterized protein (UPF0276 family)